MDNSLGDRKPGKVPEIWGGIECSINRVQNTFTDQFQVAGHYKRESLISSISALGIKAIRFPVLWEYHQPHKNAVIDWSWTEQTLHNIRENGIVPIAGLVHHGGGPAHTGLHSETFAEGLQAYSVEVAKKFPWLQYYTPVNEPLTTARFSGLYGLWYPHYKNDRNFIRMLLNQVKGTVLAMKAIRKINPEAQLLQTEDLGKTFSTPFLQYQADFENERRWLTFDLLCGKVDTDHPLWDYLIRIGITVRELSFFLDNPCPPDILGLNYYVTSERFLDDDINKYPKHLHGGNGMECYVDTEAVRIDHGQESGLKHLFKEVHQRYDMPMALTEVQLHCTREEQLRWFKEAWNTCRILNEEGAQIKAVTAWSLFGAYGWNTLLTRPDGEYEPGVFDLRSPEPRPTALFNLIRSINTDGDFIHPLLSQKGWWHREQRFLHNRLIVSQDSEINHSATPVLIIGKNGVLGQAFAQSCEARAIPYHLAGRDEIDLSGEKLMNEVIEKYRPWAVINTGGYIDIDEAEKCPERCYSDIIKGPQLLSALCKKNGIKFVSFSREVVFSGKKATPYVESDNTDPVNVLGRSKVEMETLVLRSDPASLIIRTGEFFGSMNNNNFVSRLINTLRSGKQFNVAGEITVSPAYLPDLVNISLDLMIDDEHGIWHLANQGHMTLSDLAYEVAERAGLKKQLLLTQKTASMPWVAKRPLNSSLASEKSSLMPSLHNALDRFFHEYYNDHSLQAAGCTVR